MNKFKVGDNVFCDDPEINVNPFMAIVIEVGKEYYTIRDQEDDCFQVEEKYLSFQD